MKKTNILYILTVLVLCAAMVFSLSACNMFKKGDNTDVPENKEDKTEQTDEKKDDKPVGEENEVPEPEKVAVDGTYAADIIVGADEIKDILKLENSDFFKDFELSEDEKISVTVNFNFENITEDGKKKQMSVIIENDIENLASKLVEYIKEKGFVSQENSDDIKNAYKDDILEELKKTEKYKPLFADIADKEFSCIFDDDAITIDDVRCATDSMDDEVIKLSDMSKLEGKLDIDLFNIFKAIDNVEDDKIEVTLTKAE